MFKDNLFDGEAKEVLIYLSVSWMKCSDLIYVSLRLKTCSKFIYLTKKGLRSVVQSWFISEVDEVLKVNLFCWVDADGRLASGPEAVDGLSVARQGVRPAKLHVLDRKIININGRVYLYSYLFIYLSVYLWTTLISFTFIYSTACPLIFVSSILSVY